MGDRANYVLVHDGRWELHYSHWGAIGLELDLLAGPGAATRFIRAQRTVDAADGGWLDDLWCDGAALVDHDRHRLCYYTDHFDGFEERAAVLSVLARTWPGWTVDWAYDGLADLVAHVGQDRAIVRTTPDPREPGTADDDWVDCLLTVAGDGEPRAYALNIEASEVIRQGPAVLGLLPSAALRTHLGVLPTSGVHLDLTTRSAGVWTLPPLTGALSDTSRTWPDWRWEMWDDHHTRQLDRYDGRITLPEPDLRDALDALRTSFVTHPGHDPATRAQQTLDRLGTAVTVSPYFFDHKNTPPPDDERSVALSAIADLLVTRERESNS